VNAVTTTAADMTGRYRDIRTRLEGLELAVTQCRGRADDVVLREAAALVDRVTGRLTLSADHTIVALAGATGSGKSSLFNALSGLEVAAVGLKRPTTSWPLACAWGMDGATELLDWLEIPKRHQLERMSLLDESPADRDLHGLVLLDLPDHDSTEVSHHLEVHRLVELADLLIWVLDPQKYADAAIHERFLRPLRDHADSMLVLLNHSDELGADAVDRCRADLARLLVLDGLGTVPVLATSATTGDGLPELRRLLGDRVAAKDVARARLVADIRMVAGELAAEVGDVRPPDPAGTGRAQLLTACAGAVGVPALVDSVERSSQARVRSATDWPLPTVLARLRSGPATEPRSAGAEPGRTGIAALGADPSPPAAVPIQRPRVDAAVRDVVDRTVEGMGRQWADSVRHATVGRLDALSDQLDSAAARTDLRDAPWARWLRAVRLLQWTLLVAAITGGAWLLVVAAVGFVETSRSTLPTLGRAGVPVVLLVGGLVLGFLIDLAGRVVARRVARSHAARAEQRLRRSLEAATDDLVVEPLEAEVAAYNRTTDGLAQALAD
jgi:GTP-binding protein EngB required for normal cell division